MRIEVERSRFLSSFGHRSWQSDSILEVEELLPINRHWINIVDYITTNKKAIILSWTDVRYWLSSLATLRCENMGFQNSTHLKISNYEKCWFMMMMITTTAMKTGSKISVFHFYYISKGLSNIFKMMLKTRLKVQSCCEQMLHGGAAVYL